MINKEKKLQGSVLAFPCSYLYLSCDTHIISVMLLILLLRTNQLINNILCFKNTFIRKYLWLHREKKAFKIGTIGFCYIT